MTTAIYSVMHFLVDFICAWSMFGFFRKGDSGYGNILVYNFCAFALQMPLGALLDVVRSKCGKKIRSCLAPLYSCSGAVLTLIGALIHPLILGLGNALFHVGGGMDVIQEDFRRQKQGRLLGIFVAPGAFGIYLGTLLGSEDPHMGVLLISGLMVISLAAFLLHRMNSAEDTAELPGKTSDIPFAIAVCCFLVVILRSWVGLGVVFPWKVRPLLGFLAVCCTAGGKVLGGFASARWGIIRTVKWSLLLAAVCYLLGNLPGFGLAALLLFNMSMPNTLYLLVQQLPGLRGFSFGLPTFGLFLGFLPVYSRAELPVSGKVFGLIGCVVSLVLLVTAGKVVEYGRVSS